MFSVLKLDNHTPAVGSTGISLLESDFIYPQDFEIPVWLSLAFWLVTEDVLAIAEGFTMDINYVDPTGQTRTINGTPFSLGIAGGFSVIPVTPIQRESNSSLVELAMNRSGAGLGSPVVAARLMATRLCNSNIAGNLDWVP